MWRKVLILLLALALAPGTWLRSKLPPADFAPRLDVVPLALDPGCCTARAFRLAGAWQLTSKHQFFGGYSALLITAPGRFLALSDRGYALEFSQPGVAAGPVRFAKTIEDEAVFKDNRDVESAVRDPATGTIWLALEGRNAVARHRADLTRETFREIPEMKHWPQNTGPEAMLRLPDGRFVALCECNPGWFTSGLHQGLLFGSDPTEGARGESFLFHGVSGYRPTDMAQLPDGRVLILARRLTWPYPPRFADKILLADPAEIRAGGDWQAQEVADLAAPWPIDNYEGIAIERGQDGKAIVWIISDDNGAVFQRTLLLKLDLRTADLPPKQKAPGSPGRP